MSNCNSSRRLGDRLPGADRAGVAKQPSYLVGSSSRRCRASSTRWPIDGAVERQIYWRMSCPLSIPDDRYRRAMMFILQWEAFFKPLVAASSGRLHDRPDARTAHDGGAKPFGPTLFGSMSIAVLVPMVLYLLAHGTHVTIAGPE